MSINVIQLEDNTSKFKLNRNKVNRTPHMNSNMEQEIFRRQNTLKHVQLKGSQHKHTILLI